MQTRSHRLFNRLRTRGGGGILHSVSGAIRFTAASSSLWEGEARGKGGNCGGASASTRLMSVLCTHLSERAMSGSMTMAGAIHGRVTRGPRAAGMDWKE